MTAVCNLEVRGMSKKLIEERRGWEDLIEEAREYLRRARWLLEIELEANQKGYGKAIVSLSKLPASSFPNFLKPFQVRFFLWEAKRLKKPIAEIKQKIARYELARFDLWQGRYGLAIQLLDKMADQYLVAGISSGILYSRFHHLTRLVGKLTLLQEGTEVAEI